MKVFQTKTIEADLLPARTWTVTIRQTPEGGRRLSREVDGETSSASQAA